LMPGGSPGKLQRAIAYGADAVYVGAAGLSMRPDEAAFSPDQLADALLYVHERDKRLYVCINSIILQEDLAPLAQWLDDTRDMQFDAVIVADPGAFRMAKKRRPDLNIHISTQMCSANSEAASFWRDAGATRIVLARECSLTQAAEITSHSEMDVEVFVHGAMCVAVSGRCLLSAYLCGNSASKGVCKHSCRWEWEIVEKKRPDETLTVEQTERQTIFFGSKDLCLIEHIPEIVKSGVVSLKVEGRMKSEYYVANVAAVYRAALDRYASDPSAYTVDPEWLAELDAVSHRPYSTGFAFGYPTKEPQSLQTDERPTTACNMLGIVESVEGELHTITVKNPFTVGEEVEWISPGSSRGKSTVSQIINEKGKEVEKSHCGTTAKVSFENDVLPCHTILRRRVS
jgi:putative protease